MRWQIFYALLYGGVCVLIIAVALWNLAEGYRLGAAVVGATALPFAGFAAMRLNNWRLIRAALVRKGDVQA